MPTKRVDHTPRQPLRVMGTAEIAEYLGVSRQWVYAITSHRSFPAPIAELQQGNVWLAEDVERWVREHRPELIDEE
ncbi:helix-turn-helix transcriptional regulator [Micromonospora echinospora]|uniref:helix-turn-helix transcriptional regulator n=1 Tax=Micromonospora echinospora TaxID=1877 RepID=UPI0037BD03DE